MVPMKLGQHSRRGPVVQGNGWMIAGPHRRVLWLAQRPTLGTKLAAERAAASLGLPLEVREVGDAGLERALEALVAVSS